MADAETLSAGEVAAILGLSRHESPLSLYALKTGAAADRWARAKDVGRAIEPSLVGLLQIERPGWTCYTNATSNEVAKLQRRATDDRENRYVVVVKNVPWPEPEWPPRWLVAVVQWTLLQACETRALIGVLVEGQTFKVGEMGANREMQDALRVAADAFLERVALGIPPEPTDHAADLPALKRLYPRDDGHAVALGPNAQATWDRCKWLRKRASELKREAELAEARIRAVMKEHSIGLLPDKRKLAAKLVNGGRRLVQM